MNAKYSSSEKILPRSFFIGKGRIIASETGALISRHAWYPDEFSRSSDRSKWHLWDR